MIRVLAVISTTYCRFFRMKLNFKKENVNGNYRDFLEFRYRVIEGESKNLYTTTTDQYKSLMEQMEKRDDNAADR